jgi:aldehyde:ferredoxin oxidoreductase
MQPGYKYGHNLYHVMQGLGICNFVYLAMPDISALFDAIKAVTGWELTYDEFFLAGERIANMRHLFDLREGVNILQQDYPDRIAGRPPKEEGPLKGVTLDEKRIVSEYLQEMDWDLTTTMPSRKKLEELGMQDLDIVP